MLTETNLESTFESQLSKIYKFFYYKSLDPKIAEELTAKTFSKFIKVAKKIDITDPEAYILGVARNVLFDYAKKKYNAIIPAYESTSAVEYVNNTINEAETSTIEARLQKYLKHLAPQQAEVMNLRLTDKLSANDIATKLAKDLNYVQSTQSYALENLRRFIICIP